MTRNVSTFQTWVYVKLAVRRIMKSLLNWLTKVGWRPATTMLFCKLTQIWKSRVDWYFFPYQFSDLTTRHVSTSLTFFVPTCDQVNNETTFGVQVQTSWGPTANCAIVTIIFFLSTHFEKFNHSWLIFISTSLLGNLMTMHVNAWFYLPPTCS